MLPGTYLYSRQLVFLPALSQREVPAAGVVCVDSDSNYSPNT